MRTSFVVAIGSLALALAMATASLAPAFAASSGDREDQSPQYKTSNSGPYDGADFEAAKRAFE